MTIEAFIRNGDPVVLEFREGRRVRGEFIGINTETRTVRIRRNGKAKSYSESQDGLLHVYKPRRKPTHASETSDG